MSAINVGRVVIRLLTQIRRLRTRVFTVVIRGGFRRFGRGSRVSPPFRFAGISEVEVGERVNINRDCWITAIGESNADGSPKLIIGSGCGIGMGATIAAARRIVLGERVLMARNVYISDHGHEYRDIETPIADQGITEPRPVCIGDGTWLGQNACVLPGLTIGRHCIVGANAVVTRNVPDFCVVAGAPATAIRRYDAAACAWVKVKGSGIPGKGEDGIA